MGLRRFIQLAATVLTNAYWLFPFGGASMYAGRLKSVCVPGLNCWSCPAAVGACPIGALQNMFAGLRPGLEVGNKHFGLYVIGMLGVIGSLVGRMPCAWVCPFGFFQELMHKIPSPKLKIPGFMSYLKYVFLGLFVILLPLLVVDRFGFGQVWFCKYVCPTGTLEAGIPMLLLKPGLRDMVGTLFHSKLTILAVFLIWMILCKRPFCRVACPLGAIYSLFNRSSAFRMTWDADKCTHCEQCYRDCPMDVKFWENPNHVDCIRCLKCYQESCKYGAISYEIAGIPARKSFGEKQAS